MAIQHNASDAAFWDAVAMGDIRDDTNDLEDSHYSNWVFRFVKPVYCAIVFLGLISNSWMIYYLFKFSTLHIVPKIYLVNRALVDFLYVLNLPLFIGLISSMSWNFGKFGCRVFSGVVESQPLAPALFLVIMCLDFFLVHRFPKLVKQWRTPSKAITVSFIPWILTSLYLAPITTNAYVIVFKANHCVLLWDRTHFLWNPKTYLLYRLVCGYVVPFVIVAAITVYLRRTHNLKIIVTTKTEERTELQKCNRSADNTYKELTVPLHTDPNQGKDKRECQYCCGSDVLCWKLVVVMFWLVFLTWIPFWVAEIYIEFILHHENLSGDDIRFQSSVLSSCLASLIPVINPVVVTLVSSNVNVRQLLLRTFSNFQRFWLRCRQYKTLNQVGRRARRNLWEPLIEPTTLDDVRTVEE